LHIPAYDPKRTPTPSGEYAYDDDTEFGRFDKALDVAVVNKWTVANMKKDWRVSFPSGQ
jgi:hypothetical protein